MITESSAGLGDYHYPKFRGFASPPQRHACKSGEMPSIWLTDAGQWSDADPSPLVETDAVRRRLGMELRRWMSPSRWFSLKRSTAPKSEGLRPWMLPALPGVGGPRDGDDAIEDVDVAGDGGPPEELLAGPRPS